MAEASAYDLIAIDHYMPGQDGLVTLGQLQSLPNTPPVVYVTGSDESRIAVAALKGRRGGLCGEDRIGRLP